MAENIRTPNRVDNVLSSISDAMPVYDMDGKKVGKVRSVYFGDQMDMSQAARPDEFYRLPPEMQVHLAHDGFVQVDCGFFARDAVVTPEDIELVNDREIRLAVHRDMLQKM